MSDPLLIRPAKLKIAERWIGEGEPTYFIADIAANHDGDIERAKKLVVLAKEAGADAAKFQNFTAEKIVSKVGFETLGGSQSHQAKWRKSVFDVYVDASVPSHWTRVLHDFCREVGIHYFSSPYDFEAVDMLDPFVPAYKIGSGDITWPEMLKWIASKNKPVILAAGASTMAEVEQAVRTITAVNPEFALLQCNTNYTGSLENFKYIQLNVLRTFAERFPGIVLGLSDHTPGHTTVLGAVALGARIIEKHFTDDKGRSGPDHPFSMNPGDWREMVHRTRELEAALGSGEKKVEANERETVIIQRRCLRARTGLAAGSVLTRDALDVLRPAPADAIFPFDLDRVIGKRLAVSVQAGDHLRWEHLES